MPEQSELNFDDTLPAGKMWFSVRFLARHWGKSVQHVINLVQSGELRDGADMRGKESVRSDTIVPRASVVRFLERRRIV